jgi:hypothetical protein
MSQPAQQPVARKSGLIKWIVLASVALFLGLSFKFLLPKGYSDDLSHIGKGKAVLVLVRDNQTVQSHELMEMLENLRGQYEAEVEFLLTDYNTPKGKAFMQENDAGRVSMVLFNAKGVRAKILYPPQTPASLGEELDNLLDAKP